MKKRHSFFFRAQQRHPVLLHLFGMMLVQVCIIFLPVVLYAVLFQPDIPFAFIIARIPWGPVLLVIAIVAALSLLNMPLDSGIWIQAAPEPEEDDNASAPDVLIPEQEFLHTDTENGVVKITEAAF
ncbi:MAG: hypothetical protein HY710_12865 [Candidatus Latescibacteria bacterium]|nr:hypothetical protein [Candidatus Latescibacterota bacterium]